MDNENMELPDSLNIDWDVLDEENLAEIKEIMASSFAVEYVRLLKGKYRHLVNHYADSRLKGYAHIQYMHDVCRDLRDHMVNNGVKVEKKMSYKISKALAECLKDPDFIHNAQNQRLEFTAIRVLAGHKLQQQIWAAIRTVVHLRTAALMSKSHIVYYRTKSQMVQRESAAGKLVDLIRCMRREHLYASMPDENFDGKAAHFRDSLDMEKCYSAEDIPRSRATSKLHKPSIEGDEDTEA
eukprot:IDg1707t1